jgi:hypothetical protein
MALPLVPVLIGAAAGAAITYVLLNSRSSNPLGNAARDLTDSVESGASKVTGAVSGAVEDATKVVQDAAKKVSK